MKLRIFLLFCITNFSFAQIKKAEHQDFRSKKEIEQEKVIQKMKENFKTNYLFLSDTFYTIDANLTINANPFYTFQGSSKLSNVSAIGCESKYFLDKEKFEAYKQSENNVFKKERAPREMIPFYLSAVFSQLENIYENYNFFQAKDYTYTLSENNDNEYYYLSFRCKNSKLPIQGKIILHKNNCTPKSLEYTILSDYTFEMSTDNFNHKKSVGYTARVSKELIKMEFQNVKDKFSVSKYQSEYEFKNEENSRTEKIDGDLGNSKIILTLIENEPKTCIPTFNLDKLE